MHMMNRSGCKIVSTNVGGIPELLPMEYGYFVDPTVEAVVDALRKCLRDCENSKVIHPLPRTESVNEILSVYNWNTVCLRLMGVYDQVMKIPKKSYWHQIKGFWNQGIGSFVVLLAEWLILVGMNLLLNVFDSISTAHFNLLNVCYGIIIVSFTAPFFLNQIVSLFLQIAIL